MKVSREEADARLSEGWQHPTEVNSGRLEEEGADKDRGGEQRTQETLSNIWRGFHVTFTLGATQTAVNLSFPHTSPHTQLKTFTGCSPTSTDVNCLQFLSHAETSPYYKH